MSSEIAERMRKRIVEGSDDTVARHLPDRYAEFVEAALDEELAEVREVINAGRRRLSKGNHERIARAWFDKILRQLDPKGSE